MIRRISPDLNPVDQDDQANLVCREREGERDRERGREREREKEREIERERVNQS